MILPSVSFKHNSFCILPFYGMEFWLGARQKNVSKSFCCLVPDEQDRESVKADMLAGRRPQSCQACWRLEDQGLVSDRLIKNQSIDHALSLDIQKLLAGQLSDNHAMLHYKIDSNNTCNSTCVVCDSTYSSSWAQLERKHGQTPQKSWQISSDRLDLEIDYKQARSVGFRGGEPMLSDQTWHVLEKLLQANNVDCFINFTTNGSVPLTQEQKKLIAKFNTVTFNFSIDGVGPVFEYLRFPLQWKDIERNIQYCRNNQILVTASYTISNLNILYHSETQNWFKQNQIHYSLNPVYSPEYFRPGALTKTIKDHILQQQQNDTLVAWLLGSHDLADDRDFELFKQRISQQDLWRGIHLQDYLPEFYQLLG